MFRNASQFFDLNRGNTHENKTCLSVASRSAIEELLPHVAYVLHSAKISKEEHGIYQGGAMENRRKFGNRRQNGTMPSVPFKDSKLVTVWECRRKIPDRRIGNTQGE